MTELEELKLRIEIESLQQRLSEAEKRIDILVETLSVMKDIKSSQQISEYLDSQARILRASALLNSVSDNEKLVFSEQQQQYTENIRTEQQALNSRIDEAVSRSGGTAAAARNAGVAEVLDKWQSKQPEGILAEAMKYLAYSMENGEVTITGFIPHYTFDGELEIPDILVIPEKIEGRAVTRIGDDAFHGVKLKKIMLPERLVMIGKNAFSACTLSEITFPESLMNIGAGAFASCAFTEIHLEHTHIMVLPEKCFGWCGKLNKVMLPDTLLTIENNAFVECSTLDRIIIPEYTQQVISPFSDLYLKKSRALAILGMETELVDLCGLMVASSGAKNVVVYCLPDSRAQKYCLEHSISCRHLSEFPGI